MTGSILQHARLRELVAAFADGELPAGERETVEEHLRSCEGCRRELALQETIRAALVREPGMAASPALRRRIEWMGDPVAAPAPLWGRRWAVSAAAALVVMGVASGALVLGRRAAAPTPMADIPLVRDALADCRRAMARNFPRKADVPAVTDGLDFPVRPLQGSAVELFSTWKTTLAGAPAAGLAYRWRGIVVVQYAVAGDALWQQPAVGEALTSAGVFEGAELGQSVVAILEEGSGTLLVAEAPADELRRLIL